MQSISGRASAAVAAYRCYYIYIHNALFTNVSRDIRRCGGRAAAAQITVGDIRVRQATCVMSSAFIDALILQEQIAHAHTCHKRIKYDSLTFFIYVMRSHIHPHTRTDAETQQNMSDAHARRIFLATSAQQCSGRIILRGHLFHIPHIPGINTLLEPQSW